MTLEHGIVELLKDAQHAHHEYETNVLKGVRNEQWAAWYADWIFQQPICGLLLCDASHAEVTEWLTQATATYNAETDGKSWARYTAQYIIDKMTGNLIA